MAVTVLDENCTRFGGPVHLAPRTVHLLFGLALLAPLTTAAQESASRPTIVRVSRYAKWPALAAAVGFTAAALSRNRDADQVYDALTGFCNQAQSACRVVDVGGVRQYQGNDAERLYQETLRLDHSARGWLIAGEVSLVAAGTMFFLDLIAGNDGPQNIPFKGLSVIRSGRRLGLRVAF